ncbi:DUF1353 domain-containing protein [Pacificoceanicola onchidii]|uniref:DUF1353 domain-containing protein n=1 Tax=Pacificoceanicola onchidii TaxID=2562685 RepID=UPI0010A2EA5E|nr:DUF1353 domain-containing protein [Pacificoceanicola onchidii]
MKRLAVFSALAAVALTGCAPLAVLQKAQNVDAPVVSCEGYSGARCAFDQAPLRVLQEPVRIGSRPYEFFPTASQLNFVDADGTKWLAPRRTLTDGASIPRIFISIVGDPTSPEFINAAAMHDAYCGVGNETGIMFHQARWQDVHKMFYDGLVVGGTDAGVAKLMFAAVWLGGPRWETSRIIDHVPVARKQRAMRQAKSFIVRNNPSLGQLIRFLEIQDTAMLTSYPRPAAASNMERKTQSEYPQDASVEEEYGEYGYGDYDFGDWYDPYDPNGYGDPALGPGLPAAGGTGGGI